MARLLLIVLALASRSRAPERPAPPKPRPVYCGMMRGEDGDLDSRTTRCVGRVLADGRVAVVGVVCPDGVAVGAPVMLDDDGEIWIMPFDEACAGHMEESK